MSGAPLRATPPEIESETGSDHGRAALPDIIYLPDLSPPEPEPKADHPNVAEPTDHAVAKVVVRKGRHFGGRRVEDPRTERLDLRLTRAELQAMKIAAQKENLPISGFIRLRTLGDQGPRARRNPGPEVKLLVKVLAEMGREGGNLNQIDRHLNNQDFGENDELVAMRHEHATALLQHRAVCQALQRAINAPHKFLRDAGLMEKILAEMVEQGRHLNQITHALNSFDFGGLSELLAMRAQHGAALAQHQTVCEVIMTALGV
jgi:hypothetical protein